jgi:hypothetical protein
MSQAAKEQDAGPEAVMSEVYARVGILGNPSDAFEGAAIAAAITNYAAVCLACPVIARPFCTAWTTDAPLSDTVRTSTIAMSYGCVSSSFR